MKPPKKTKAARVRAAEREVLRLAMQWSDGLVAAPFFGHRHTELARAVDALRKVRGDK
jgi:hypothetical protein